MGDYQARGNLFKKLVLIKLSVRRKQIANLTEMGIANGLFGTIKIFSSIR